MTSIRALLTLALVACSGRSTSTGGSGTAPPTESGSAAPTATGTTPARPPLTASALWSYGGPPIAQLPGIADPRAPRQKLTAPKLVAAGGGRVVLGTHDGCLEQLELATGTRVGGRVCGEELLGLEVLGDTVVAITSKAARGHALADLAVRWETSFVRVRTEQPAARPARVRDTVCLLAFTGSGDHLVCLDATGKRTLDRPDATIVGLGRRSIGLVEVDASRPQEPHVIFLAPDGTELARSELQAVHVPAFRQVWPVFQIDGGGGREGWTASWYDEEGRPLGTAPGPQPRHGGAPVGDALVSTIHLDAAGDEVVAQRAGTETWRTRVDRFEPFTSTITPMGDRIFLAMHSGLVTLDRAGKVLHSRPIASQHRGVWNDRALVLVEAMSTVEDGDQGSSGVTIVDLANDTVVLTDDLGRQTPGAERARPPVFVDDVVVVLASDRVRAYRLGS